MPQATAADPPLQPHVFASHEFAVHLTDSDGQNVERLIQELRDLLPSRVSWRESPMSVDVATSTLRIADQRCASHIAIALRKHRVIRTHSGEVQLKASHSNNERPEEERPDALASRLNMDKDLWDACRRAVPALEAGASLSPSTGDVPWLPPLLDWIASNVTFVGAYDAAGQANPLIGAVAILHERGISMHDLKTMLRHRSRYVRACALVFGRYALAPEDLARLCNLAPAEGPLVSFSAGAESITVDRTRITTDDSDHRTALFCEWARQLLLTDEVFELWLPTYDPQVVQQLQRRIERTAALATTGVDPFPPTATKEGTAAGGKKPTVASKSSPFAGFASAVEMALHFKKAVSRTSLGPGLREEGDYAEGDSRKKNRSEPLALPVGAGDSAAPAGVAAKKRQDIVEAMRQNRLARLAGRAAVTVTPSPHETIPTTPLGAAPEQRHLDDDDDTLWPSERVGPFNQSGKIDDIFATKERQLLLFSAVVAPNDIPLVF